MLQQGHEQVVFTGRAGKDDAIDEHQMLCIAVLHKVPFQLGSFYLLERRYFWHSHSSPCGETLTRHIRRANVVRKSVIRSEMSVILSVYREAIKRRLSFADER
jgi:hypothetical protein